MIERARSVAPLPPLRPGASMLLGLALMFAWGLLRVVVFSDIVLPLTYVLPMLVCVWTQDRRMLWTMAAGFAVLNAVQATWLVPAGTVTPLVHAATFVNICVGAGVVDTIIRSRRRLRAALTDVRAQRDELAELNDRLRDQADELGRQGEEIAAQIEQLTQRNEEVQIQAEEIQHLNTDLSRREEILDVLLGLVNVSSTQRDALGLVVSRAAPLWEPAAAAVLIYKMGADGLSAVASAPADVAAAADRIPDRFVALAIEHGRPAALADASLRPDLPLLGRAADRPPFAAVLAAPIAVDDAPYGAIAVYAEHPYEWSEEQFRFIRWLAAQCGRLIETLRAREQLTTALAALDDLNRNKSQFLATLSHELRNPLAAIRYALDLLQMPQADAAIARRVVERQLPHLVRLVDDLLDAARIERNKIALRRDVVDLRTVVQEAIDAARLSGAPGTHRITAHLPDAPAWVSADPDRLLQAVTNVMSNAIRYTPDGGAVTVTLSERGERALLSVADTGAGIRRQDLGRIFDMFAQNDHAKEGLGIGLALVKSIIDLHGGSIEARSEGEGHGSEFVVELPRATAPPPERGAPPPLPVSANRRVLVVDDNEDAASMLQSLLELRGHTVWTARNGADALRLAEQSPPDVVLLDIGLPGMDGFEVAAALRRSRTGATMFLVALTGWGSDHDRVRARDAGFDAHVTKPAELHEIERLVAEGPARARAQAGDAHSSRRDTPPPPASGHLPAP
ncbi:MAG: response regulator [Acidobacteria bacterium]|nr:response regulator [Acidobacteriota bacterium]